MHLQVEREPRIGLKSSEITRSRSAASAEIRLRRTFRLQSNCPANLGPLSLVNDLSTYLLRDLSI
jgi:hypothetical protein